MAERASAPRPQLQGRRQCVRGRQGSAGLSPAKLARTLAWGRTQCQRAQSERGANSKVKCNHALRYEVTRTSTKACMHYSTRA
eukprot:2146445-Pleurochrysis_carterae.AAC.1